MLAIFLLAMFRTHMDAETNSSDCGVNPILSLNEHLNESQYLDAVDEMTMNAMTFTSTDENDRETSYNKLEKTFKEFESKSLESESFLKEIDEFMSESSTQSLPVLAMDQIKPIEGEKEEIDEINIITSKTSPDLNNGKITTTIKLNSFMTIKSTIKTNGMYLGKQLNFDDDNKLAEATFDIDIPQLDINVSVSTDIIFDAENFAKINSI